MTKQEIDVRLAELADEHVHKWDTNYQNPVWACSCGEESSKFVKPPSATPRAHSTELLLDYADKQGYDVSMLTVAGKGVTMQLQNPVHDIAKYSGYALYNDHPTPGHARRHALATAIISAMEAKK